MNENVRWDTTQYLADLAHSMASPEFRQAYEKMKRTIRRRQRLYALAQTYLHLGKVAGCLGFGYMCGSILGLWGFAVGIPAVLVFSILERPETWTRSGGAVSFTITRRRISPTSGSRVEVTPHQSAP